MPIMDRVWKPLAPRWDEILSIARSRCALAYKGCMIAFASLTGSIFRSTLC